MSTAVLTNLNNSPLTHTDRTLIHLPHQPTNEATNMKANFNKTRVKLANPYFDRYYRAVPRQEPVQKVVQVLVPVVFERSTDSQVKVLQ